MDNKKIYVLASYFDDLVSRFNKNKGSDLLEEPDLLTFDELKSEKKLKPIINPSKTNNIAPTKGNMVPAKVTKELSDFALKELKNRINSGNFEPNKIEKIKLPDGREAELRHKIHNKQESTGNIGTFKALEVWVPKEMV